MTAFHALLRGIDDQRARLVDSQDSKVEERYEEWNTLTTMSVGYIDFRTSWTMRTKWKIFLLSPKIQRAIQGTKQMYYLSEAKASLPLLCLTKWYQMVWKA
jgi:hypothetical protein